MNTLLIPYILACHWFADFVMQPHEVAASKSKSLYALLTHIKSYTFYLTGTIFLCMLDKEIYIDGILLYGFVNSVAHMVVDYCSSKITAHFWNKQDYHNMFVIVGIDQFIHTSILILTIPILYGHIPFLK